MSISEIELNKTRTILRQACDKVRSMASSLEKGKSHTPICDALQVLETKHAPERCLVYPLISASPAALHHTIEQISAGGADRVTAALAEHSFIKVRFYSPENEAAFENDNLADLHLLNLPAQAPWPNTILVLARDIDDFAAHPAILLRAQESTGILLLAAEQGNTLNATVKARLEEILPAVDAVLPITIESEEQELTSRKWWACTPLRGVPLLPEIQLTLSAEPEWPELLFNGDAAIRQVLVMAMLSRGLIEMTSQAANHVERDLKNWSSRCNALSVEERSLEDSRKNHDTRADIETLRLEVDDFFIAVSQELEDANRKAVQRNGALTRIIRGMADAIGLESLKTSLQAKSLRKVLDEPVVSDMKKRLRQCLRERFAGDMALVNGAMAQVEQVLARAVGSGATGSLLLPRLDAEKLWNQLEGEIDVEIRNQDIEVPRRHPAFIVLSDGRKFIMFTFMTISMVGFSRSQLSSLAGGKLSYTIIILGIVAAGYYAVLEHGKESAERINKGLEKLRDAVVAEAAKVISDFQREKAARISAYLSELKKAALRRGEDAVRESTDSNVRTVEAKRQELKSRLKAAEQKVKEYQDTLKQIAQISTACTDVVGTCRKMLLETAPAPPRVSASRARK